MVFKEREGKGKKRPDWTNVKKDSKLNENDTRRSDYQSREQRRDSRYDDRRTPRFESSSRSFGGDRGAPRYDDRRPPRFESGSSRGFSNDRGAPRFNDRPRENRFDDRRAPRFEDRKPRFESGGSRGFGGDRGAPRFEDRRPRFESGASRSFGGNRTPPRFEEYHDRYEKTPKTEKRFEPRNDKSSFDRKPRDNNYRTENKDFSEQRSPPRFESVSDRPRIDRKPRENSYREDNNRFEGRTESRNDGRSSDRNEGRSFRRSYTDYGSKPSVKVDGLVIKNRFMYVINTVPGFKTKFDKIEHSTDGKELRLFEPRRSKLGAALTKGLSNFAFKKDSSVLYLGSSHGYTVSFLSDLCKNGVIFCIDIAPRVMRDLVYICEKRKNLIPVLGDANDVSSFANNIFPSVDVVFMDVAQKNQAEIFVKNCGEFLKKEGFGYLALKSRAVDTTKEPNEIYDLVRTELNNAGFLKIVEEIKLDPIQKDHLMFIVQKS